MEFSGSFQIRNPTNVYSSESTSSEETINDNMHYNQSTSRYSSMKSESTSDIFYISYGQTESNCVKVELDIKSSISSVSSLQYAKHQNIDTKPLSLCEHVHLSRIHYLTLSNCIRLIITLVCSGWFIFNAYNVFEQYLEHNTIVIVEYTRPESSIPPAITICTDCIMCDYEYDINKTIYVEDILENDYILAMLNDDDTDSDQNNTQLDVVIKCEFLTNTISNTKQDKVNCTDVVPVVVSMQEGNKCFTYFSNIYGEMSRANAQLKEMMFDYSPVINLQVSGKWITFGNLMVAIHSPTVLPPMQDINFHLIDPGKEVDIRFSKTIQYLKPPPSKPLCFLYRNSHFTKRPDELDSEVIYTSDQLVTNSGTSIYRTRGECFLYCVWRETRFDMVECINAYTTFTQNLMQQVHFYRDELMVQVIARLFQSSDLPTNESNKDDNPNYWTTFCKVDKNTFKDNIDHKQHCLDQCPESCLVETFYESLVSNLKNKISSDKGQVSVQWATMSVTEITHRENMGLTEFFGTLGGHAHIWLGLSVIHIVKYLIRLTTIKYHLPQTSASWLVRLWRNWCCRRRFGG